MSLATEWANAALCPRCHVKPHHDLDNDYNQTEHMLFCDRCGLSTDWKRSGSVVASWNSLCKQNSDETCEIPCESFPGGGGR